MPQTAASAIATDPSSLRTAFPRTLRGAFDNTHIALMSHLSRLHAYEANAQPGEYLFSLVVTPAVARARDLLDQPNAVLLEDDDLPAPIALENLLPWLLGELTLAVAVQIGNTQAAWNVVPPANVTLLSLPNVPEVPPTAELDTWKQWLLTRIQQPEVRPAARHARETLARAATGVFPHNFALRQAVCFRVSGLPPATDTFRLAALPRFAKHGGASDLPVAQVDSLVGWDAGTETTLPVRIAGYVQALEFPGPPVDPAALIDLTTLRVKVGGDVDDAGEGGDWLRHLAARCGGLFDLAQRIVDAALAQPGGFDQPGDAPARAALWKWILATSRDLAGSGWKIAPTGANLPLDVAQQATGGDARIGVDARALAGALTDALQADENTWLGGGVGAGIGRWLEFLRTAGPGASAEELRLAALFTDLPVDWPPESAFADSLARWNRFLADLRAPANARILIRRQWSRAVTAPVGGMTPDAILAALEKVLKQADNPVALLARGVVGDFWGKIIHLQGVTDSPMDAIAQRAREQFLVYGGQRADPAAGFFPVPDVPLPALTFFDQAAATATLFPARAVPTPERVPGPLVLRVDQIAASEQSENEDAADLLREIAGVVVFIRANGAPGARSLNLGRLVLPELDPAHPRHVLASLSLVPCRLGYLNGTRTAHLTYDNASLIARSEGGRINANTSAAVPATPGIPAATLAVPHYELPAKDDPLRVKVRLPALAYGRTYDVSCFAVLNAGILPPRLAHPAHPAVLLPIPDHGFAVPPDPAVDWQPKYLRRVAISAPAFTPDPDLRAPGKTKLPRAFSRDRYASPLALELLAAQKVPPGQEPPLALLYPASGGSPSAPPAEVAFSLSKPATEFQNWECWVIGAGFRGKSSADLASLRAGVRAHLAAQRDQPTPQRSQPLDDPALQDFLYFTAEAIFAEPAAAALPPQLIPVVITDELCGTPVAVTISHGGAAAATVTVAPGSIQLSLPAGSIWRLKFYGVVREADLNQYFDLPITREAVSGHTELVGISPFEMLVELASATLPDWTAIYAAMTPRLFGRQAVLDLERPSAAFAFVGHVETALQIWSWSGRPTKPFPFRVFQPGGGNPDTSQAVFDWEVEGFGHRPDSACRTETCRVTWNPGAGDVAGPVRLLTENREADGRALYLRWSVRVASRYPKLSSGPVCAGTTPRHPELRWRRCLLPARMNERLPKPSLKLILPLGARVGGDNGKCLAVLAVFNDAWYQQAGIAEKLEARISTTPYQPNGGGEQRFLRAGHDPIISTTALPRLIDPETLPQLEVSTPAGHTFDADADEPLIVGTSFNLLLPDTLPGMDTGGGAGAVPTADWFMASVQFRRTADPDAVLGGVDAAASLASEWTASEWVQFVPAPEDLLPGTWARSLAGADPVTPTVLRFRAATEWEAVGWVEPYTWSNPGGFQANRFEYWFVLTREMRELSGQPAEAYVATLCPDASNRYFVLDYAADAGFSLGKSGRTLVLRVVEVRTRDRAVLRTHLLETKNPWELLFGANASTNPLDGSRRDANEDVLAQITRISPPLQVITDVA